MKMVVCCISLKMYGGPFSNGEFWMMVELLTSSFHVRPVNLPSNVKEELDEVGVRGTVSNGAVVNELSGDVSTSVSSVEEATLILLGPRGLRAILLRGVRLFLIIPDGGIFSDSAVESTVVLDLGVH
jgi:hypothetical protein